MTRMSPKDRLFKKVDVNGPVHPVLQTSCWVWLGGKFKDGYGCITGLGESRAHRLSWVCHFGPIPDGKLVLHRCDNPLCVRPDHLFLGTDQDNSDDKMRKGRDRKPTGDDHWTRKHPERLPRGDNHRSRLHPKTVARGEQHGLVLHPERRARGERSGTAKLTADDVKKIIHRRKVQGASYAEIEREFGIKKAQIWRILNGTSWSHLRQGVDQCISSL